jgi:hypothetical protein
MSKVDQQYVSIQQRHDEAIARVQAEAQAELKELEPLAQRFEEVKLYLSENGSAKPPKSEAKPRVGRPRKGKKTHGDRLVEAIQKDPSLNGTQLANKLGITVPHLHQTRKKEIEKGRLRRIERGVYEVV